MNTQNAVINTPANIVGDKQANAVEVPVTKRRRAAKLKAVPSVAVSMAIIESAVRSNKPMPEWVSAMDTAAFMAERIKTSGSALRDSVLAAAASCRMGEIFESAVEDKLRLTFPNDSTIANIFSCARNVVPALRGAGVELLKVPNLYGMREVKKVLCDKEHEAHKAVVAGIKKGESLAKLKALVPAKPKGATPPAPEAKPTVAPVEGITFTGDPSQKEQLRRAFDLVSKLMRELPSKVTQEIAAKHLVGYTIAHKADSKTK